MRYLSKVEIEEEQNSSYHEVLKVLLTGVIRSHDWIEQQHHLQGTC